MNSEFAKNEMAKYGWSSGKGLGAQENGISKHITVGFKNDTKGVGSANSEWNFEWWDHVFNKASAGINVESNEEGEVVINSKSNIEKKTEEKKLLYKNFVKASTATNPSSVDFTQKISDAELLAACEGRTARKGARHDQRGKVARADGGVLAENYKKKDVIVEQEEKIEVETTVKIKKSKKKSKKEKVNDTIAKEQLIVVEAKNETTVAKKKSKKKDKNSPVDVNETSKKKRGIYEVDTGEIKKKKKKRRTDA